MIVGCPQPDVAKQAGQLFGMFARGSVDNAWPGRGLHVFEQARVLARLVGAAHDAEVDVGAVEALHEDRRVDHAQPFDDFLADGRRSRRRQRQHARGASASITAPRPR